MLNILFHILGSVCGNLGSGSAQFCSWYDIIGSLFSDNHPLSMGWMWSGYLGAWHQPVLLSWPCFLLSLPTALHLFFASSLPDVCGTYMTDLIGCSFFVVFMYFLVFMCFFGYFMFMVFVVLFFIRLCCSLIPVLPFSEFLSQSCLECFVGNYVLILPPLFSPSKSCS